jgi:DNA-binding transcriptional regulator YiaG
MTNVERLSRVRAQATSGEAKRIRVAAHLSELDFARVLKVHHTTIGRWERGERLPTGDAALRYAALLDRLAKAAG